MLDPHARRLQDVERSAMDGLDLFLRQQVNRPKSARETFEHGTLP
jgi:hypothetical protein